MKQTDVTNVMVLGGGYAGLVAAFRLSRKTRGANVRVTLISGRDHFVERIRLHQQAAGQTLAHHSYERLLAGTSIRFLKGWVDRLMPRERRLLIETPAGEVQKEYDYAILAVGSIADTNSVPGVSQHALSLSTTETARTVQRTVPEVAASGGRLLVCGGGLTGIEAASELAETYPDLNVTLVTSDIFGEQLSGRGQNYLRRAFHRLGITIINGQRIAAVHANHVRTEYGARIPFDICLWAGSFRAPDLARKSGLLVNGKDQILVDEHLRAQRFPTLYAVGDIASLEEAIETPIRMGCVTAAPMGAYAGDHLAAVIQGQKPVKPYRYTYFMRCISLGRNDGLVQFVEADDTPRERILTGRVGAKVKEVISRSSVWNVQMEHRMAALFRRPQLAPDGVGGHASSKQHAQPY